MWTHGFYRLTILPLRLLRTKPLMALPRVYLSPLSFPSVIHHPADTLPRILPRPALLGQRLPQESPLVLVAHATHECLYCTRLVQADRPPNSRLAVPGVFLQRQISLNLQANGMLLRIMLLV